MGTVTRVYLTLTPGDLDALTRDDDLSQVPASAVTAALRAAHPQEDDEGLEFQAMQEAAAATAAGQRVLIAAADVTTPVEPGSGSSPAAARVGAVTRADVVSFHLGDPGVAPSPDAETELSWFDVSELDDVRRLMAT